jgi:pullulanase
LVPGYYYRQTKEGKFSNATACGNETASERPMFRKFMLESMKYWVQEYHVDGFRVDLMGVHDITTMNLISEELHKIKPGILIYGEGWTAGASPLPDSARAIKANAAKLYRIAVFSDDLRDGIKGSVFEHTDKGFASGKPGMEESIKFGVTASCPHPQVEYSKVNYSKAPYSAQPYQTISYCECHDNHVLWDKLAISAKEATEEERINMHQLALSIVLTSQGIDFLHAGTEFLRTKKGVENSFESPDSINAIDWNGKTINKEVFEYVKALIKIRKAHPAFRMSTAKGIAANISFQGGLKEGVIGFTLDGKKVKDSWSRIRVYYNGTAAGQEIILDSKNWKTAIFSNRVVDHVNIVSSISLRPFSCTILYQ